MFKKILLATDGSECAKVAEKYAIQLAKEEDGEITAINVVDIYSVTSMSQEFFGPVIADLIEDAKKNNEKILNEFKAAAEKENVKVKVISKFGKPEREIIEESKKGYDVIVMGSKGLSGIERYLIGSVAEHVVRYAEIPVLVVKLKKEKKDQKKILC